MIPIKTTFEDIDKLLAFLRPNFGWVSLTKVKANLDSKTTDNRKLEAARWIGLIKRDGQNVEITDAGRAYASTQDPAERARIMAGLLAAAPLYAQTVEWMYHANKSEPTKTDVGDQWYKHYSELLEGAQGAALGDGVIMFMRVAQAAGLGKFITAGNRRPETYFKGERPAIEQFYNTYVLGKPADDADVATATPRIDVTPVSAPQPSGPSPIYTAPGAAAPVQAAPQVTLQASPAIHINLEIHIAADATATTVAEIFKNMRKYVLSDGTAEVAEGDE
ncbi:hypothetical protein [Microlunatus parietis]|uniref:Uncharacterized protein n=1 Tax=Microlunatus parietis TaxID=682979 RepID=A0A7Y9I8Z1_9ACTN|nr:hypothetical protein [Microlunatus parietis]NYE72141.1 hypothetical protein [Microlunatus parietis]